jgi:hypothetical protein
MLFARVWGDSFNKRVSKMRKQNLIQAYQQAPWRAQLQYIGIFLSGLVIIALVAGVYLYISAQTASAGARIQILDENKIDLRRRIADMEAQLASLQASDVMAQRAAALGYEPIDPQNVMYMDMPGYPGRQSIHLAPEKPQESSSFVMIKSSYTESLWEWFYAGLMDINEHPIGGIR